MEPDELILKIRMEAYRTHGNLSCLKNKKGGLVLPDIKVKLQ